MRELIASAQLARRLALWQLDRPRRAHGRRADRRRRGATQRQRPARADGDRCSPCPTSSSWAAPTSTGRCSTSSAPAPPSCTCRCSRSTATSSRPRTACRPATTPRPSASPTLALATGRAAPRRQRRGRLRRRLFRIAHDLDRRVAAARRERADAAPPTRGCGCGRSPVVGALVDAGRLDEARTTSRSSSASTACTCRTTRCSSSRRARSSPPPPRSATRSGPRVLRQALEPYADRIAVSGLAGISIGPVSGYVGVAAMVSGDLDAAAALPAAGRRRRRAARQPGPRGPDARRPRRRPRGPQPPG